jgi:hypothetical protein
MKSLMLIGAFTGCFIGFIFGLRQEESWPTMLWHASAGAYLGGLLMRWWGHAWRKSLAESLEERQNAPSTPLNPLNAIHKTAKS